jgi:hypothetical protein
VLGRVLGGAWISGLASCCAAQGRDVSGGETGHGVVGEMQDWSDWVSGDGVGCRLAMRTGGSRLFFWSSCNGAAFPPARGAQHENNYHGVAHDSAPNNAVPTNGTYVASVGRW